MNWFKMFCIDIIYFIYFGGGVVVVGHAWVLQLWVLVSRPPQSVPPPLGAGLSHLLDALCEPPPQVLLHRLQGCHEPHLPWTTDGPEPPPPEPPPPELPASSPWMRNMRIHSPGVIWSWLNTTGCPVKLFTPVFKSNLCLSCKSDLQMEYLLFLLIKIDAKLFTLGFFHFSQANLMQS